MNTKIKRIVIDTSKISDWETFHSFFSTTFGFPDFYGYNMNAWIDCMSSIGSPEDSMTSINCSDDECLLLELAGAKDFKKRCPELFDAILECSSFVNYRNVEIGERPLIMLSFYV